MFPFPGIHREIREAIGRWALHTKNARSIIRKSGFRLLTSEAGIPRPILSIEGSRRVCFSGATAAFPHDESQWAIRDGLLFIWGVNLAGDYAVPSSQGREWLIPTLHPRGLEGVVDVAASNGAGPCVLLDDGTVYYSGRFRPPVTGMLAPLTELSDVVQIAHHDTQAPTPSFYFLKSDGTVSHMGTFGAGMSVNQASPEPWQWRSPTVTIAQAGVIEQMPTSKVSDVVEIACQSSGLVFRRSDGVVGIWRYLQENPEYPTGQPTSPVTKIHAGLQHPLLLTGGGEIWGTGDNTFGQYGDGTTTTAANPYVSWHKADGSGYTDVAGAEQRVLAVRDGTLWSWGQGGPKSARGISAAAASTPQDVGVEAEKVFGNYDLQAPMLQREDGCVMIWGDNAFGYLGRGYRGGSEGTPQILQFSGAYPEWQVV